MKLLSPRFDEGTIWSFSGVEVVEVAREPTPPTPLHLGSPARRHGRVAVIFLVEGDVTVSHDGGQFRFAAGSAAFALSGTPTMVESTEPHRAVVVSVPRDLLQAAGVDVRKTFGAFAYSTARSSPLLSFLLALIEIVNDRSLPSEPTATVLSELVARLFLADNAYSVGAHQPDLDLRALADSLIALGSSDAGYGAKTLAKQLRMSSAELERTFRNTGAHGSAGEAIRERRITMAMLGLQSTGVEVFSLKEIAQKAGFSNENELHRGVKAVYGTTVKAVLLAQTDEASTSRSEA
ncbi:MAG: hypothetical protein JWR01_2254 [Subtercola sp.]|nr:hypothetical protein [Subtercola sp.]